MNAAQGKHARDSSRAAAWLSSLFEDDHRRRIVLAFAIAIAFEEILAALIPWRTTTIPPEQPDIITIAKLVKIEHRPTPKPKPIVHAHVIAPTNVQPKIINPGKPSENQHVRRVASARPLVHTRYHSKPAAIHVPTGGRGAGTSKSATALTGGVGLGGTGTGESGNGNGTGGAPAAHEPCGYVDFVPSDPPTINSAGQDWEHITMVVHFPDGTTQSDDLDYPFYYSSRARDPFVPENKNIPATFQFPPAGKPVDSLVQYVIQHTTADGFTKLKACPGT